MLATALEAENCRPPVWPHCCALAAPGSEEHGAARHRVSHAGPTKRLGPAGLRLPYRQKTVPASAQFLARTILNFEKGGLAERFPVEQFWSFASMPSQHWDAEKEKKRAQWASRAVERRSALCGPKRQSSRGKGRGLKIQSVLSLPQLSMLAHMLATEAIHEAREVRPRPQLAAYRRREAAVSAGEREEKAFGHARHDHPAVDQQVGGVVLDRTVALEGENGQRLRLDLFHVDV